jgi:hypothetical protein
VEYGRKQRQFFFLNNKQRQVGVGVAELERGIPDLMTMTNSKADFAKAKPHDSLQP